LIHSSVLIVSDDTEFARTIAARWQAERHVPEITLATSDVWHPASSSGYDLVIVGPVRHGKRSAILSAVSSSPGTAAVYVADEERDIPSLRADHPHLLVVPRQDGWAGTLILVSIEALRRVEAAGRAQRAERLALACERQATLGRYMLEMRPSFNNALTSVLGNADLLLVEPGQVSGESREQIRTIHTMALRLNEIMQRFSSLATEMQADEKVSHPETKEASPRLVAKP
jgi:signal transduction histidine kinase